MSGLVAADFALLRMSALPADHRLPVLRAALPEGVDRWFFIRYFDPGAYGGTEALEGA